MHGIWLLVGLVLAFMAGVAATLYLLWALEPVHHKDDVSLFDDSFYKLHEEIQDQGKVTPGNWASRAAKERTRG